VGMTSVPPFLRIRLDTTYIIASVITVRGLHAQRGAADGIASRGPYYIFTVEGDQSNLRKLPKALPCKQTPVWAKTSVERGHGRIRSCTLKATDRACGIGFTEAVELPQLLRKNRRRRRAHLRGEVVHVITLLTPTDAKADEVASWLRGGGATINLIHRVDDVTFSEDRGRIRIACGPRVMAALRNTAISLIREPYSPALSDITPALSDSTPTTPISPSNPY